MVAVQAYGHEGLGILAVAGVPSFPELRQKLLPLTAQFAVCSTLAQATTPCYA